MSHDVFICHSSKDRAIATAICSTLEQHRIRCWIAPRDVLPGSDYAESIVEAISSTKLTVLVFSEDSNRSTHVRREVERSVSHGIPILPFRVDEVAPSPSLEYFISDSHWLDAVTPPLEQHLEHLVGTVRLLLERETGTAAPLPPPVVGPPTPPEPAVPMPPPQVDLTPASTAGRPVAWWVAAAVAAVLAIGLVLVFALGRGGDEVETGPAAEPERTSPTTAVTAPAPTTAPEETTPPTSPETVAPATAPTPAPVTTTRPPTTPPPDEPERPAGALRAPVDVLDGFTFTEDATFTWDGGVLTLRGHGTYVAPDEQDCTLDVEFAGMSATSRAVVTGGRAWYDAGYGLAEIDPDDPELAGMLSGCPTSDTMWGDDWGFPLQGGDDVVVSGLELIAYDVSELASSFGEMFGLPPGLDTEQMVMFVSRDRTWVAGMEMDFLGSAESFRLYMGFPPEGVTGDCRMTMTVRIERPNDPSLTVEPPT